MEGAEPGDTLAVHFVEIAPARDWAVSTTFPHFGALTATHNTAMLHDPLEEVVWVYEVDRGAGHLPVPAAPRRARGGAAAGPDARHARRRRVPCIGSSGSSTSGPPRRGRNRQVPRARSTS